MTPEQVAAQATPQVPDATPNVPNPQAPVEQAPVEQAPVAPVEPAPAPVAEPSVVEAPPVEENYDEDPIPTFNLPRRQPVQEAPQPQPQQPQSYQTPAAQAPASPQLDPSQFTDAYGNVDMGKFSQALADRDQRLIAQVTENVARNLLPQAAQISANQMMEARKEERAWKAAETKYPELATNKELRDLVHKTRISVIQTGGNDTPLKAADRLMKFIGSARQEGQAAATESVRVQAAAHLESADNTAPAASPQREYKDKISSRNRQEANHARVALLRSWMDNGDLKI